MRSLKIRSYLFLGLFLLIVISLPNSFLQRCKGTAIGLCSPLFALVDTSVGKRQPELTLLEQENRVLREELQRLQGQIRQDEWVGKEMERLQAIRTRDVTEPYWKEFFERRARQLAVCLERQILGIPAKVVFRDPSFWNSHIWIDVGSDNNRNLGLSVVEKNSIVVIRNQLVGVVEEVSPRRSRVRLITDTQLVPSVRAIRGEQNHRQFLELTDLLLEILRSRRGMFGSPAEEGQAIANIEKLRSSTVLAWGDHYLAKGELSGSSAPLWRSKRPLLKGTGFNYDFMDEEGPARDLRSGEAMENRGSRSPPLLMPGDLLVTSGMDGVFPSGLEVAIVTRIGLLREGATTYDLDAVPIVSNLNDLTDVWVLPPLVSSQ